MLTILHGDQTVNSRQKLTELITQAKQAGRQIVHVDGAKLTSALLEEKLQAQSLFTEPMTVVIEELHSLPKSQRKNNLLELVASRVVQPDLDIILWEKKVVTATQLKIFPKATAILFKVTPLVFKWLDSLSGGQDQRPTMLKNFRDTLAQEDVGFCLAMLTRQVRLLIQAKEQQLPAMAPFMAGKLKKQASTFTLGQLIKLHQALFKIDLAEKTSGSPFNLASQLDLLWWEL